MTKRIHPNTIEEVKLRTNIYAIISGHVVLHKRGKDFVGSCPFCKEQPPKTSFTVSPSKNMYYCFECRTAGNSIKFLMNIQNRSFTDVTLELANRCGISVEFLMMVSAEIK